MTLVRRIIDRIAKAIPAGRNRRLATGVVTGVFAKGAAFGITLLIVPMTLGYLGAERYGIWVTMISMLAWLSLVDLGIANGLTPMLSSAFGRGRPDLAQQYVSTAVWTLAGIAILAGVAIAALWSLIDWGRLFNVGDPLLAANVSMAMAIAVALFLVQVPLSVNQRILLAHQEGGIANACHLMVSVAGLLGVYAVTRTEGGLVALVIGYSGAQVLVSVGIAVWLFGWAKRSIHPFVLPRLSEARQVLSLGGLFFVCQIATLAMFQKDNIVITHYLGPSEATPYNVAWQLFMFMNAASIIISPYLSPGFGEAFASGDVQWMRKAFRHYMLVTCSVAIPFVTAMTLWHDWVIEIWVGAGVRVDNAVIAWLAVWTLMLAVMHPVVSVLMGVGRLRRYAVTSLIAAVSSIALSIYLVRLTGAAGAIAASVVSFLTIAAIPAFMEVRRVLSDPLPDPHTGHGSA